ncbi:MAG: hypothetical protein ACM3SM_14470 [Bacteroidota bacterium]
MKPILLVFLLIFLCSAVIINAQGNSPRDIRKFERWPLDIHNYERMQSSYDNRIKQLQQDIIEIKAKKERLRNKYTQIIDKRIESKNHEISRLQTEKKELVSKKNKVMKRKVNRSESNIQKQIDTSTDEIGALKDLKKKIDN